MEVVIESSWLDFIIANGLLSAKVCGEAGLVEGVPEGVVDELEEVSLEVL